MTIFSHIGNFLNKLEPSVKVNRRWKKSFYHKNIIILYINMKIWEDAKIGFEKRSCEEFYIDFKRTMRHSKNCSCFVRFSQERSLFYSIQSGVRSLWSKIVILKEICMQKLRLAAAEEGRKGNDCISPRYARTRTQTRPRSRRASLEMSGASPGAKIVLISRCRVTPVRQIARIVISIMRVVVWIK